MHTFPQKTPHLRLFSPHLNLILFSIIIFIYSVGDAIMSYTAPNSIEHVVKNTFLMGLIFSASSFIGYFADIALGNLFKENTFVRYLGAGLILAITFPLVLLIPHTSIGLLLISMAVWGIYYEFIIFSKSCFVHHYLPHDKHDMGWVTLNSFSTIAYLIGPTLALYLMSIHAVMPFIVVIGIQIVALISLSIYRLVFSPSLHHPLGQPRPHALKAGFLSWQILNHKLWPVLLFIFSLTLIDATFWTVGAVLVGNRSGTNPLAGFFFICYQLPGLVFSPVGVKFSRVFGKKRTAFVSGLLAGIALIGIFFTRDFAAFLVLIGLGSLGLSIAGPEIHGAIEDYCERLGGSANSLVGLTSSMGSLAYVIGPITAGGIAVLVGEMNTFAVMGMVIAITSGTALLFVPRKIHLPQHEIRHVFQD